MIIWSSHLHMVRDDCCEELGGRGASGHAIGALLPPSHVLLPTPILYRQQEADECVLQFLLILQLIS